MGLVSPSCSALGRASPSLHCEGREGEGESWSKMPEFLIPKIHTTPAVLPHGQGRETPNTGPEHPRWPLQLSPHHRGPSTWFVQQWVRGLGLEGPMAAVTQHHHLPVQQQKAVVCPALLVAMLRSGKFTVTIGTRKLKVVSSTDKCAG